MHTECLCRHALHVRPLWNLLLQVEAEVCAKVQGLTQVVNADLRGGGREEKGGGEERGGEG